MKLIKFTFNEKKAAQAAALLVARSGGEINYLALMKLLYIVDREALLRFGRPVTGDRVVAMKHGPVLSRVFDFVSHKKQDASTSVWHKFIRRPLPYVYTVRFSGLPDTSELSEAEMALIDEIFSKFRGMDEWGLVAYTHTLPEWHDPQKTSLPIPYEAILKAGKKSAQQIQAIADNAEADFFMDTALAHVR